jgi:hypothetical protein
MALANDIVTRLYLDGAWRDISDHVRANDGVTYKRGRGGEDDTTPPQECTLALNNGANKGNGDYVERNPLGQWYGHLKRFTPAEVKLRLVRDTATATAASSWGATDTHDDGAWQVLSWTNADGVASDFNKASGKATHLISTANQNRYSYLADFSARDLDMAITLSLAITNVTGGVIGSDFLLRAQSLGEYYAMRVLIQTNESVTIDIVDAAGTSLTAGPLTVPGLTHTSSQALRLRMQCEGQTVRGKIWAAAGVEPFEWHTTFTDEGDDASTADLRDAAGFVGIRSIVGSGNTNVPVTLSYDDVEISSMIATGEVSEWPQSRDETGNDQTVRITIGGPKRRLVVSKTLARSALYQYFLVNSLSGSQPTPHAYFPMEDDSQATADFITEATGGLARLKFVPSNVSSTVSKVTWGGDTTRPGAKQSATLTGGGHLVATLSPPTGETIWGATWQHKFNYSDGGYAVLGTLAAPDAPIYLTLDIAVDTTVLEIRLDGGGATVPSMLVHDFGSKEEVEQWHTIQIDAAQSGADVDFFLTVDGEVADSHTQTSFTLRGLHTVQLSSVVDANGATGVSHLAVYGADIASLDVFGVDLAGQGNPGENPVFRAKRVAQEYGFEFDWIGYGATTGAPDVSGPGEGDGRTMGAQRVVNVIDLLNDAEQVDGGLLYEQRSVSGFQFRTLRSMLSRSSWLTLDMGTSKHLSPPLVPVPDDRNVTNRFTARRADGGEYVHSLDSGAMSTLSPSDGGIGLMDRGDSFNLETETSLPDMASYQVARGTIDQERYPAVTVELHRSAVYGTSGLVAKLRDLDVGDQITLAGMSSNGIYDDRDVIVLGYTGRLDQLRHTLMLVTTPAELLRVWTPGSTTASASEFARVDSDYTTIGEALTTTETDVTVEVESGRAFWVNSTSHPNNFPFSVMCGGEEMTVTAGTAPAGQNQTWTVTRSVNGVVKEHSAGAKISLARPNYMGL